MFKSGKIIGGFLVLIAVLAIGEPAAARDDVCDVYIYENNYNYNLPAPSTVCERESQFTLTLRNFSGEALAGFKFALYEQDTDNYGLPIAGDKVGGGTTDSLGQFNFSFKPDQCKSHVLHVWDKKENLGEFWFFNAVTFACDYNRNLTKSLPALHIVLRDAAGELKKNYSFSLYAQRYDADNNPIFESGDLIASLKTGASGQATVYVAPYNPYRRGQTGFYAVSAKDADGNNSVLYNISVPESKDYTLSYDFSGVSGELRDAKGQLLTGKEVRLYEQTAAGTLGRELEKTKTDANGRFSLEYPAGTYALAVRDYFNRENIFWGIAVKPAGDYQKLTTNLTNFTLSDAQGEGLSGTASLKLYSLSADANGSFYRDKQVGTIKLNSNRTASLSLAAGPYLAVYAGKNNQDYGQTFYAKNGATQAVKVVVSGNYLLSSGQSFQVSGATVSPIGGSASASAASSVPVSLATRLQGRILLQVESQGQAWYVEPVSGKKYYLGRPADAFEVMRRFGLGISNADLAAVRSNPGAWRRLAGRILLQTEDKGQAYYFDPVDLQLYYLNRPADAFEIMRQRGLGIKNSDLNKISSGF